MTDEFRYPEIMQPGKLRELNDYAISKLGTPIFFAAPEPSRPRTQTAVGALYEIVTGLYIAYKDYGMKIFRTFLDFCQENVHVQHTRLINHYYSVINLRGTVRPGD